ncbi:MAG: hypothetical protein QXM16_00965 [Nitrososphaerota archaeon]
MKEGAQNGLGYKKIWKTLRENGVRVAKSTVGYYYYKLFSERVGKRGPHLDRAVRIRLYSEVKRLRNKGYSYSMIIDEVKERYGVRLSRSEVSEWLRGIRKPLNEIRIPSIDYLEPSPDLAYFIGVVGDGCVIRKSTYSTWGGGYKVVACVKDGEFAEEFARCLGRVLGREPPKPTQTRGGFFGYVLPQRPSTTYSKNQLTLMIQDVSRSIVGIVCRAFYEDSSTVKAP